MILSKGEFGIVDIENANTHAMREAVMVFKGMDLNGVISVNGTILKLGYNEDIHFENPAQAVTMMKIINAVMVMGEEADNALEGIKQATEVFFQD